MNPKYILGRLKEKFDVTEEQEQEGFPDMNYVIGNSSALDIGQVPTPLKERIGSQAQVGGGIMEVKVANPASFTIEREGIISAVSQLGLDINLHSDMNVGYTSAYKSGGQAMGYDMTHDYFTRYLQELASFKEEVKNRGSGDQPLFKVGRINPHISTSQLPSLNERMAQDVGVDPFGFEINDYDENARKQRNRKGQNIYKNSKFLRRLYYTLFLEVSNYPFEQYQLFSSYSDEFDKEWKKAQHMAADNIFDQEANTLEDKLGAVLVARGQDQGIGTSWRQVLDEWNGEPIPVFQIEDPTAEEIELTENSQNLQEFLAGIGNLRGAVRLNRLDDTVYDLRQLEYSDLIEIIGAPEMPAPPEAVEKVRQQVDIENLKERLIGEIESLLEKMWEEENPESGHERYMTQEAKWAGLQRHLEIQQIRLLEEAYELGKSKLDQSIEELAADVFSGDEELFDTEDRDDTSGEKMHEDLLERIMNGQQFQREMWKESRIFYNILPAWMATSTEESENHKGWEAPEFIWKTVVEEKWGEKDDVNLDLTEPRNGLDGDDHFMDLLENSEEFKQDVAAAVGACYVWGHFTQRESEFRIEEKEENGETLVEEKDEKWTWIEWMNYYGIGVNMETMAGSPQQLFKVWRPKDISTAAHAINLTARKIVDKEGELGGREEIHPELDGCPVKFTIDMEHIASLGFSPWPEMEDFIEQEEKLADSDYKLQINPDKPIAKILRQYHLMDPGVESEQGTYHGAFDRGNKLIYTWLYKLVEEGFARNENEAASVMFELAEHQGESSYMMRITMNMIELGIKPEEVTAENVDPSKAEYSDEREALIARFFGMDKPNYDREWAKIEEHAFDPLDGLLEAEQFDYTYSGRASLENDNNPQDWMGEEYR